MELIIRLKSGIVLLSFIVNFVMWFPKLFILDLFLLLMAVGIAVNYCIMQNSMYKCRSPGTKSAVALFSLFFVIVAANAGDWHCCHHLYLNTCHRVSLAMLTSVPCSCFHLSSITFCTTHNTVNTIIFYVILLKLYPMDCLCLHCALCSIVMWAVYFVYVYVLIVPLLNVFLLVFLTN